MGICETASKYTQKNISKPSVMLHYYQVGFFVRVLASKNANDNQSNIVYVGLKPNLFCVCVMFGSEALPDINYLVCCLMKIHVHLKRDKCCGRKSLED